MRDAREGDPGRKNEPGLATWVPFPARSFAALGREMPIVSDHPDRNRRKLYGRRKGPKLSQRQSGLRRTLLGELAYRPGEAPLQQFPNSVRELWLEVGFGAGEHLVWQAEHHPNIG